MSESQQFATVIEAVNHFVREYPEMNDETVTARCEELGFEPTPELIQIVRDRIANNP